MIENHNFWAAQCCLYYIFTVEMRFFTVLFLLGFNLIRICQQLIMRFFFYSYFRSTKSIWKWKQCDYFYLICNKIFWCITDFIQDYGEIPIVNQLNNVINKPLELGTREKQDSAKLRTLKLT